MPTHGFPVCSKIPPQTAWAFFPKTYYSINLIFILIKEPAKDPPVYLSSWRMPPRALVLMPLKHSPAFRILQAELAQKQLGQPGVLLRKRTGIPGLDFPAAKVDCRRTSVLLRHGQRRRWRRWNIAANGRIRHRCCWCRCCCGVDGTLTGLTEREQVLVDDAGWELGRHFRLCNDINEVCNRRGCIVDSCTNWVSDQIWVFCADQEIQHWNILHQLVHANLKNLLIL